MHLYRKSKHSPDAPSSRIAWELLVLIAGVITLLHLLTNMRYGFHRDELQFLSDASHLDWGFVAYPPMTPFIEHVTLTAFGLSLEWLRIPSVLFQAASILVTGLMAREFGGKRLAQAAAASAVALSPLPLFEGTEFQYSSFDYFWWVLAAYFVLRLLKFDNPRWWLAIGATLGLGLETKYSITFYVAGILVGVLMTGARKYLLSGWFYAGVAIAIAIFLPNLLWLARHNFISYHFLQHIHARDVAIGRADGFLRDQVLICINLVALPIAAAGFVALLRSERYRMLGWMYLVPLTLFFVGKGRGYYLAAAYPMLFAMGAAAAERWLQRMKPVPRIAITSTYFTAVIALGVYICAIIVPLAPAGPLRSFALAKNNDLREEIGWPELVQRVVSLRNAQPDPSDVGIVVDNYGEAGAMELLGKPYRLPPPISGTNSGWLRGYGTPPSHFIVLGMSKTHADAIFTGCTLAGHNGNVEGIKNEESQDHPDIFLCGPPREPWPQLWKHALGFG